MTSTPPPQIGEVRLGQRLGVGGMGLVYTGVHTPTGAPVALKLLRPDVLSDPETLRRIFSNEVRAVAALNHPGIVPVLDYGLVGEGVFAESPYMVMPLAEGGTTLPLHGRLAWPELRELLLVVLDALSHAHARGVLHRDLKLSNLLLRVPHTPTGGVWLADFGLAALEEARFPDATPLTGGGTVGFRAPEQEDPGVGPEGPWTDLFALGKVAALLGRREGGRRAVPPRRFFDWLAWLITPDPKGRPRFAAEAAEALIAMDVNAATRSSRWRPEHRRSALEPSMSRSVLDLRQPSLFGHEVLRDQLWAELLKVRRRGGVRVACLEGGRGLGRSRLADWLGEQAHERGFGEVLRVRLSPGAPPLEQVAQSLGDLLCGGAVGLPRLRERLRARLGTERWGEGAVRQLARLALRRPGLRVATGVDKGQLGLLRRALVELSRSGPLVVLLDDLHHAPTAASLVRSLMSGPVPEGAALMFVLTASLDGMSARPWLREQLDALAEEGALRLSVEPLEAEAHRLLAVELVGGNQALLGAIVSRSAGDPGFAVELARRARAEGSVGSPEGLEEVYAERLRAALAPLSQDERRAVVLAALLGVEPSMALWRGACAALGVAPALSGVEVLLRAGLAQGRVEAPRFASALLTSTLARFGGEELPQLHRACARALGEAHPERRAQHLIAAGDLEAALAPLTEALAQDVRAHRTYRAAHLDTQRVALMRSLDLSPLHPLRLRGDVAVASLRIQQGQTEEGRAVADRTAERAQRAGEVSLMHEARRHLALAEWRLGRLDLYLALNREIARNAEGAPQARAWMDLAYGLRMEGRAEEALHNAAKAERAFEVLGDALGVLDTMRFRLIISEPAMSPEEQRRLIQALITQSQAMGAVEHLASGWLSDGRRLEEDGELEEAAASYARSADLLEAVGSAEAVVPRVALGVLEFQVGRLGAARQTLSVVLRALQRPGNRLYAGFVIVWLGRVLAHLGDWGAVEDAWLEADLTLVKLYPDELLGALQDAAERADDAGAERAGEVLWGLLLRAAEVAKRPALVRRAQEAKERLSEAPVVSGAPPKTLPPKTLPPRTPASPSPQGTK